MEHNIHSPNKVTFQAPTFDPIFLVVPGHRRAKLAERHQLVS